MGGWVDGDKERYREKERGREPLLQIREHITKVASKHDVYYLT